MDVIRKWLARANAYAVLYTALIMLALQGAWLVWRDTRPVRLDVPLPTTRPRAAADGELGLLAFLDAAAASRPAEGNPFLNPQPPRPPVVHSPAPSPSPSPAPRPSPSPAPPPPPKRETIRLTYHGMFENSSAQARALIEDSKYRRRSFYGIGEVLFGMRVQDIRMLEVLLHPTDGEEVILKLGEPREFEERPHGY